MPIDPQMGIAFPMDGELTPTEYKVKYKKKGAKVKAFEKTSTSATTTTNSEITV